MKSFHDLLFNRRSIRKYTDEEIAADDVKTILQAALVTWSNNNKYHYKNTNSLPVGMNLQNSKDKDYTKGLDRWNK